MNSNSQNASNENQTNQITEIQMVGNINANIENSQTQTTSPSNEVSNENSLARITCDEYFEIKNELEDCVKKDKLVSNVPDRNTKTSDITKWRLRIIKVAGSLIMKKKYFLVDVFFKLKI